MFQLLSKLYFLQNLLGWFVSKIPGPLHHNLGKYMALKKAFYLADLEGLTGDYLEFGVFTGSSFACALQCGQSTQRFLGFDSFDGFGTLDEKDKHPFYTNLNFKTDFISVKSRLENVASKNQMVALHKGFFSETLAEGPEKFKVRAFKIALIDCDTYSAAKDCFAFLRPVIQAGSIIVIDDFFSYKGSLTKGCAAAFEEFQASAPDYRFRKICDYGMGGVVFIACL